MRFVVANDRGGKPSWWLYSANNALVAWAGESFDSLYNATRAAQAFKSGAYSARYETYLDAGGNWRWRAWRSSDKVAASGESFSSDYAAQRGAETVKVQAGGATGP